MHSLVNNLKNKKQLNKSYSELVLELFDLLLHRLQLLVLLQPLGGRARAVGEL